MNYALEKIINQDVKIDNGNCATERKIQHKSEKAVIKTTNKKTNETIQGIHDSKSTGKDEKKVGNIRQILHEHGLRTTLSRIKILQFIDNSLAPYFSVDDVYESLIASNNASSRSCIANTLNFLVQIEILSRHPKHKTCYKRAD